LGERTSPSKRGGPSSEMYQGNESLLEKNDKKKKKQMVRNALLIRAQNCSMRKKRKEGKRKKRKLGKEEKSNTLRGGGPGNQWKRAFKKRGGKWGWKGARKSIPRVKKKRGTGILAGFTLRKGEVRTVRRIAHLKGSG